MNPDRWERCSCSGAPDVDMDESYLWITGTLSSLPPTPPLTLSLVSLLILFCSSYILYKSWMFYWYTATGGGNKQPAADNHYHRKPPYSWDQLLMLQDHRWSHQIYTPLSLFGPSGMWGVGGGLMEAVEPPSAPIAGQGTLYLDILAGDLHSLLTTDVCATRDMTGWYILIRSHVPTAILDSAPLIPSNTPPSSMLHWATLCVAWCFCSCDCISVQLV